MLELPIDAGSMNTRPFQLLTDFSTGALAEWCQAQGEPAFRARQIQNWVFQKRAADFDAMHNLPLKLREVLKQEFAFFSTEVVKHQVSRDRTEKLLLALADGNRVECVLMREPKRVTACISTQVGCAMGCVFCASGMLGLERNLSTGEILEQVLRLDRLLAADERMTNVVVMGIGEPLANLGALLPAVSRLHEAEGLGISARRITISTVGLPGRMRELADFGKPFKLAVSLHAPNDALRNELVPVNEKTGIQEILAAADNYFRRTGRRITYEYVLLAGINDAPQHARELAGLLKHRDAHVNLIPMNDVKQFPIKSPRPPRVRRFAEVLEAAGIAVTTRKRKGEDIDAACGQLRLKHQTQLETRNGS